MGQGDALEIRALLRRQDREPFEVRNKPGGRPSYAPDALLGMILNGILNGERSLRGLERLARRDLECLRITGGRYLDHAAIGRSIQLHAESLTGDFLAG